jgi:hypothetical protein
MSNEQYKKVTQQIRMRVSLKYVCVLISRKYSMFVKLAAGVNRAGCVVYLGVRVFIAEMFGSVKQAKPYYITLGASNVTSTKTVCCVGYNILVVTVGLTDTYTLYDKKISCL